MKMPDYIKDEIDKYIYERKNGIERFTTYENILAFVRLAVINERITEEEANEIILYLKNLKGRI